MDVLKCWRGCPSITSSRFVKVRERRGVSPSRADMSRPGMRMTAGLFLAIVMTSLAFPHDARAQRDPVLRAFVSLDATLGGPYGDEGVEVSRRFDELTQ